MNLILTKVWLIITWFMQYHGNQEGVHDLLHLKGLIKLKVSLNLKFLNFLLIMFGGHGPGENSLR